MIQEEQASGAIDPKIQQRTLDTPLCSINNTHTEATAGPVPSPDIPRPVMTLPMTMTNIKKVMPGTPESLGTPQMTRQMTISTQNQIIKDASELLIAAITNPQIAQPSWVNCPPPHQQPRWRYENVPNAQENSLGERGGRGRLRENRNRYQEDGLSNQPPQSCFHCGDLNHWIRQCPFRPLCTRCGKFGHEITTCNYVQIRR